MTWTPTKQQLEDAALAGGKEVSTDKYFGDVLHAWHHSEAGMGGMWKEWQPHLPTVQGRADLLDLMLAAEIEHEFTGRGCWKPVYITSNLSPICTARAAGGEEAWAPYSGKQEDKHAALMQAAITVAAQVFAKMREGVC